MASTTGPVRPWTLKRSSESISGAASVLSCCDSPRLVVGRLLKSAASASGVKTKLVTGAGVFVTVGVLVGEGVFDAVGVGDAVAVAVGVEVLVGVGLGPTVGVIVAVAVAVGGIVAEGVIPGVGVGTRPVVTLAAKVPRVRAAVLNPLICNVWPLALTPVALSQQAGFPVPVQSAGSPICSRFCGARTSVLQETLSSTGMLSVQVATPETGSRGKTS